MLTSKYQLVIHMEMSIGNSITMELQGVVWNIGTNLGVISIELVFEGVTLEEFIAWENEYGHTREKIQVLTTE